MDLYHKFGKNELGLIVKKKKPHSFFPSELLKLLIPAYTYHTNKQLLEFIFLATHNGENNII